MSIALGSFVSILVGTSIAAAADEVTNSVGITLRMIEAGRYERGEYDTGPGFTKDHSAFNTAEDDRPVHPVVLTRPFYLATTEVTVAQFRQFVEAAGYTTSAERNPKGAVGWDPRSPPDRERYVATFRDGDEFDWRHPGFEQADDHPVVGVSFADAQAYCEWLSTTEGGTTYRLPTEAEWEYAARAGTQSYFSFGDEYRGTIQRFANIGNVELERAFPDRVRRQWLVDIERDPADRHVFTAPVGSYEPNPWGLFDLYGNVWEWCQDRYLDTAYAPFKRPGHEQLRERAIDPLNLQRWGDVGDWRVIRGGSWFNAPIQCRSSVRGYFEAGDAACYVGFRIARDASAEQIAAARQAFERSEAARVTLIRLADRVQERRDGRLTVELSQQRTQLTDEFLAALGELDEPVDLHIDGRGELTPAQLAGLLRARHPRGLILSNIGQHVADADFSSLANHIQLELLQLTTAPRLTDGLFAHLQDLDQLERVQFDGERITDDGLRRLARSRRLKSLRISGTASRGLVLDQFQGAPLESFACDHLDDEGAQGLGKFSTLREVSIAGSPITGLGLAAIARLPRLQQLDLSRCASLRDADFAVLGSAYELGYLQLVQTEAGDQAALELSRLNNLRELQIGSGQLTDAGLRQLCRIVSLRNFQVTSEAVGVTDAGLADLWRLVNLHSLGIAAPQVTGSGLATLNELPALEWLSLQGTHIADIACEQAAKSDSLRQLFIGTWQEGGPPALSDAGLRRLAAARNLRQVDVMLKRTQVTDAGVAELRRLQPRLTVNAHGP
jgi:formylglycine-generating enzyme required for sulfatase activity